VIKIIKSTTFTYIDNDDYDTDGVNEYGVNDLKGTIQISSLHWDSKGVLDKPEIVDTFFHEIQHSRVLNSNHTDKNFQFDIDIQKRIFNRHWKTKWN
jgi:hypothetical protein